MPFDNLWRPSGIDAVDTLHWGTHFCQFYETSGDLTDTLVPYFRAGLEAHELCLWITSEPLRADTARQALEAIVPDLEFLIAQGQMQILDSKEWCTPPGDLRSKDVFKRWNDKLEEAVTKGYEGVRFAGNAFWLGNDYGTNFTKQIKTVNDVLDGKKIIALCSYPLHTCSPHEIAEAVAYHEFTLIKHSGQWQTIQSPHYKKTRQSLHDSEVRYRSLYTAMDEGVALHEIIYGGTGAVDYRIIDVNPAFERITGISRETAADKKASDLYGTGEPPFLSIYARVAETGVSESFETFFAPMNRTFRIKVLSSARGFFATVFEDITERKKAEEKLVKAEEQRKLREEERNRALLVQQKVVKRFELLAHTAGELLHTQDPQKIITKLCTNVMNFLDCQAFFNFLADENSGRLHLNSCSGIPEEEKKRIEWLDYGVAVCGCVARDGIRIVAEQIQKKSDPLTELVKSYGIDAYACHPLLGPGEKVIGTLSFGTRTRDTFSSDDLDLMKAVADQVAAAMIRMQSDLELMESRKDLCRAQSVAQIGSWRLNVIKNELTWSDENHRIFGLKKGEPMTYETFLSVVHPDDRDYVDQKWHAGLAGKPYDIEHRIVIGGTVRWVRETAELEFDPSGKLLGGFGTTQDITSRKEDEEELRKHREELERLVDERTEELRKSQEMLLHAQKMEAIGLLAGGIAHDFNNMMQVVIGYAHHTLRKLDFENPLRENLEQIGLAAKSASTLTHRLLAFSRKQMLQPQVFSLNDLILKIKPMLRHTLDEDIEFNCNLQPDLGYVKADPVQFEQVIMNMTVNARNAMPDGGKLIFQTADVTLGAAHPFDKDPVTPGNYVMLAITDTGCGMDNATLEKIFEPFFTTRPFGSGSGLGLATAYGTIRQSAGAIRVYSEPGKGTTFKIFLPRCEEKPRTAPQVDTGIFPGGEGRTVLVVEDNSMAREFVAVELRDLGYHVLAASNAEDAYAVSHNHRGPLHLLLTDVVLPGTNGLDVSRTLSAERPEMATLYMSGYDREHIVQQGKLIAGARLLVKPFSPEQLAAGVREALKERTAAAAAQVPSGHANENMQPAHILVVDDDPGIAEIIAEILRESGDIVEAAEDGETAIKLASTLKPEFVLLDINLPDMDGYELARRIRELSDESKPYIIAASGYSQENNANIHLFDEYLIKPIDFARLRELVANRTNSGT